MESWPQRTAGVTKCKRVVQNQLFGFFAYAVYAGGMDLTRRRLLNVSWRKILVLSTLALNAVDVVFAVRFGLRYTPSLCRAVACTCRRPAAAVAVAPAAPGARGDSEERERHHAALMEGGLARQPPPPCLTIEHIRWAELCAKPPAATR